MKKHKMISLSLIYSSNFFVFFTYAYFGNQLSAYYGVPITTISLYFSLYGFVALFLYLPSGVLADRFNPKSLVLISSLGTAAIYLGFAFYSNIYILIVLMMLYAVSSVLVFYSPWLKMIKTIEYKSNRSFVLVYTLNAVISFVIAFGVNYLLTHH